MANYDAIGSSTITNTSVFTKGSYINSFSCTAVKTSVYVLIKALTVAIGPASQSTYIFSTVLSSVIDCGRTTTYSEYAVCSYKFFDTSGNKMPSGSGTNYYLFSWDSTINKVILKIMQWRSTSTINTTFNLSSNPVWYLL